MKANSERPFAVETKEGDEWTTWSTFVNLPHAEAKRDELDMIGKEARTTCSHGCPPDSCLL